MAIEDVVTAAQKWTWAKTWTQGTWGYLASPKDYKIQPCNMFQAWHCRFKSISMSEIRFSQWTMERRFCSTNESQVSSSTWSAWRKQANVLLFSIIVQILLVLLWQVIVDCVFARLFISILFQYLLKDIWQCTVTLTSTQWIELHCTLYIPRNFVYVSMTLWGRSLAYLVTYCTLVFGRTMWNGPTAHALAICHESRWRNLVVTKRSCWLAAYCEGLKALRCEKKEWTNSLKCSNRI